MLTHFRPVIRSRHPSHTPLRKNKLLPLYPFKSVIRFGSFTDIKDTVTNGGDRIEINTIEAITKSSNKLLMKNCFTNLEVPTAKWYTIKNNSLHEMIKEGDQITCKLINRNDLPFPLVAKNKWGSKGNGNYKLDNKNQLKDFIDKKNNKIDNYIFEKFYNYNREYRLHIHEEGCFYTCRKMIKNDTDKKDRWFRNDKNSVWILEDNPSFDKPNNWDDIIKASIKSLKSIDLDVGAVDVKVQSSKNKKGEIRENPEFIILEINSAPSFGDLTLQKYIKEIPKILINKKQKCEV